jgi:hypothetical protein
VKILKKEGAASTPLFFNSEKEASGKTIQRIVVFYEDGTFEEYQK